MKAMTQCQAHQNSVQPSTDAPLPKHSCSPLSQHTLSKGNGASGSREVIKSAHQASTGIVPHLRLTAMTRSWALYHLSEKEF